MLDSGSLLSVAVGLTAVFFVLMIRRPPRSTLDRSSAASDVYKRQEVGDRYTSMDGCVLGDSPVG